MAKSLLLLFDSMIYFDRELLKGIQAKANEIGVTFDIHIECPTNEKFILSRHWDYVIADYDKPHIKPVIEALNCKVVVYSSHKIINPPDNTSSICLNNEELANTALKHFEYLNIKNISYFANHQDAVTPWSTERYQASKTIANLSNINYFEDTIDAIQSKLFPLGVYCSSDRSARRLANLCHSLKIKVPEQVSIIGTDFDDIERTLSPVSLSSVEFNPFELGKMCMETLHKMVRFKRIIHTEFSQFKVIHSQTTTSKELEPCVSKAEGFIQKNFHKNIKIEQVTDHCRVSRKTLDTRFQQYLGKTAHQYLTDLRISRAKLLLTSTSDTLEVIARQCGYLGQSYLSQVFLKQVGVSPAIYRKENTQNVYIN